jgi:CBS domain-containing protein
MSSPVVTVTADTTVKQAATLLVEHGFNALPVVEGDELVGIVTEADLVPLESTPDPRRHLALTNPGTGRLPRTVGEVMTGEVITLPPTADAAEAARLMQVSDLRSIPVTTERRVVGIVTRRDLLRVLARGDHEIHLDLTALLAEEFPGEPVGVSVADGMVTLTFAETLEPTERRLAELLARSVPGVLRVRSA